MGPGVRRGDIAFVIPTKVGTHSPPLNGIPAYKRLRHRAVDGAGAGS